jgi:heme/copper-type cytochrome/quinol oxidase subunit 1
MLFSGETLLRGHLGKIGFLVFWMTCFGFTMLAMLMALLDLSSVQRRAREQQRKLLEGTLGEIVHQKEERKPGKLPE